MAVMIPGARPLAGALGLLALMATMPAVVEAQSAGPAVTLAAGGAPPACSDPSVPPPEQREPGSYRPVQRRGMVVPPLTTEAPVRGRLEVEFLVNAAGTVDSVSIRGAVAPWYRPVLRSTLMTHTFWPAVYRGCAVPGRMTVALTFP